MSTITTIHHYMYVLPLPGFQGIRAEVKTNNGTLQAWFPFPEECRINHTQWWQVGVWVRNDIRPLTVVLFVHHCHLPCNLNTDARLTSGSNLEIQSLELFGRGTSQWMQQRPDPSCGILRKITRIIHSPPATKSCTKPPPSSTNCPACVSQNSTLTLALLGAAEAVVVVLIVVVVVKIIRDSRKQQN